MLHISPQECLMYEEISIKVSDLDPAQHVTVRCEVTEGRYVFDSFAHFVASLDGVVDLTCDGSYGGSYKGIDKMGIFWSMVPAKGQRNGLRYIPKNCMSKMKYKIQVYEGHLNDECFQKSELLKIENYRKQSPIVEDEVSRKCNADGVTRNEVKHGRVRGTIFKPPGVGPFKGVIDFYGGSGGINESRVALLASLGFISFILPHNNYSDLVESIDDVEIEYFLEAIEYFSSLDAVQPNIGILAVCGGGSIGLFLSTLCTKITAVITFGSPYAFASPLRYQGIEFPVILSRHSTNSCMSRTGDIGKN